VTYSTPEIRVACADEDKFEVVAQLKITFQQEDQVCEVVTIDGARIIFADGWGLVRASNTEPALVLRFEATTAERLEAIQMFVVEKLRGFPSVKIDETPTH
jgi:phosphomannomutase / phosphoglucomutase